MDRDGCFCCGRMDCLWLSYCVWGRDVETWTFRGGGRCSINLLRWGVVPACRGPMSQGGGRFVVLWSSDFIHSRDAKGGGLFVCWRYGRLLSRTVICSPGGE